MDHDEASERIVALETNMEHVLSNLDKLVVELNGLKSVIWKAVGGATAILGVVQIVAGKLH